MKKANFAVALAASVLTLSFWGLLNRPYQAPGWPDRVMGFSFSPTLADQDPFAGRLPGRDDIDVDLALLAGKAHAVRTYTVRDAMAEVPALARKRGMNVALGAWLDGDGPHDEAEVDRLVELTRSGYRNVVRVMVGNEVIRRQDMPVAQLIGYLDRVRGELDTPVSTAEPWHVWLEHPELADHVDYIAAHVLPYWEGVAVEQAVDYVVDRTEQLRAAFPGKPVVLAEVGWPSRGRTRGAAVASRVNQATFLRHFLSRAPREGYTYYLMEAFDQPWKRVSEGAVGAYWGVYDAQRQAKFPFVSPVVEVPEWPALAAVSVLAALLLLAVVLKDSRGLRISGRSFLTLVAFVAATAVVWVIHDYLRQYLTLADGVVGVLLLLGMLGVVLVVVTEAHEWAEARWLKAWRRQLEPAGASEDRLPMVSIHVPAFNEPPQMLMTTLDALACLDYPRYEVVVVDNNTADPAVWRPVQAHCAALGPRFRFHHVAPLAGFKAGALNYSLAHTDGQAQVIAVVDSDYLVHVRWLRDLVPQLLRPEVAIVQAPQDYRDQGESLFKSMCYQEYRGFFHIGMMTRNERNAIIQHGTMTLVRRAALEEVGGWSEWSITEDAELGLRILEHGYEAAYTPQSYGRGLIPDTFANYKKQRFRWAYGAVQILRRRAGFLAARAGSRLSIGQRYHFLGGWLPWLADGLNLFFTVAALLWSAAMVLFPERIDPPLVVFSLLPLSLFGFKLAKLLFLYRSRVRATFGQSLSAALAGLSLSHTVALAVLSGCISTDKPFFRTPKMVPGTGLRDALGSAREETLMMLALWLAVAGVLGTQDTQLWDVRLWAAMLVVQSVPYLAALVVSVTSSFPRLAAGVVSWRTIGSWRRTPSKLEG
ncbi:MAG: glycosyltransferase [Gammaproteobacteria bacterium]|nr:glycosyltransferase [Gammaproteobacteria bacterium]